MTGALHQKTWGSHWPFYGGDYAYAPQVWCWYALGMNVFHSCGCEFMSLCDYTGHFKRSTSYEVEINIYRVIAFIFFVEFLDSLASVFFLFLSWDVLDLFWIVKMLDWLPKHLPGRCYLWNVESWKIGTPEKSQNAKHFVLTALKKKWLDVFF